MKINIRKGYCKGYVGIILLPTVWIELFPDKKGITFGWLAWVVAIFTEKKD